MASVVDICNSALNLLGASTITALTEDSKNARLCNQRYEPIRNRTFRSHAWNCLTKRVQLAKEHIRSIKRHVRSLNERVNALEEELKILTEDK